MYFSESGIRGTSVRPFFSLSNSFTCTSDGTFGDAKPDLVRHETCGTIFPTELMKIDSFDHRVPRPIKRDNKDDPFNSKEAYS